MSKNILSEILKISNHWFKEESIKEGWTQFLEESSLNNMGLAIPVSVDKSIAWNLFYNTMLNKINPLPASDMDSYNKLKNLKEDSNDPTDRRLMILVEDRERIINETKLNLRKLKDDVINHIFPIVEGAKDFRSRSKMSEYSEKLSSAYSNTNYDFIIFKNGESDVATINVIKNYNALNLLAPGYMESILGTGEFSESQSLISKMIQADKKIYETINKPIQKLEKLAKNWTFEDKNNLRKAITFDSGQAPQIFRKEFVNLIYGLSNFSGGSRKTAEKAYDMILTGVTPRLDEEGNVIPIEVDVETDANTKVQKIGKLKNLLKIFPRNKKNILDLLGLPKDGHGHSNDIENNLEKLKKSPYVEEVIDLQTETPANRPAEKTIIKSRKGLLVNFVKIANKLGLDTNELSIIDVKSKPEHLPEENPAMFPSFSKKAKTISAKKLVNNKDKTDVGRRIETKSINVLEQIKTIVSKFKEIRDNEYKGTGKKAAEGKLSTKIGRKRQGIGSRTGLDAVLEKAIMGLGLSGTSISEFKKSLLRDRIGIMPKMIVQLSQDVKDIKDNLIDPSVDSSDLSTELTPEQREKREIHTDAEKMGLASLPKSYSEYYNIGRDPITIAYNNISKPKEDKKESGEKDYKSEEEIMAEPGLSSDQQDELLKQFRSKQEDMESEKQLENKADNLTSIFLELVNKEKEDPDSEMVAQLKIKIVEEMSKIIRGSKNPILSRMVKKLSQEKLKVSTKITLLNKISNLIAEINGDIDLKMCHRLVSTIIANGDFESLDLLTGISGMGRSNEAFDGLIKAAASLVSSDQENSQDSDHNAISWVMEFIGKMGNPPIMSLRDIDFEKPGRYGNRYKSLKNFGISNAAAIIRAIGGSGDIEKRKRLYNDKITSIIQLYGVDMFKKELKKNPRYSQVELAQKIIKNSEIELKTKSGETESFPILNPLKYGSNTPQFKEIVKEIIKEANVELSANELGQKINEIKTALKNSKGHKDGEVIEALEKELEIKRDSLGSIKSRSSSVYDLMQKFDTFRSIPDEWKADATSSPNAMVNKLQQNFNKLIKEFVSNIKSVKKPTADKLLATVRIALRGHLPEEAIETYITNLAVGARPLKFFRKNEEGTNAIAKDLTNTYNNLQKWEDEYRKTKPKGQGWKLQDLNQQPAARELNKPDVLEKPRPRVSSETDEVSSTELKELERKWESAVASGNTELALKLSKKVAQERRDLYDEEYSNSPVRKLENEIKRLEDKHRSSGLSLREKQKISKSLNDKRQKLAFLKSNKQGSLDKGKEQKLAISTEIANLIEAMPDQEQKIKELAKSGRYSVGDIADMLGN